MDGYKKGSGEHDSAGGRCCASSEIYFFDHSGYFVTRAVVNVLNVSTYCTSLLQHERLTLPTALSRLFQLI